MVQVGLLHSSFRNAQLVGLREVGEIRGFEGGSGRLAATLRWLLRRLERRRG